MAQSSKPLKRFVGGWGVVSPAINRLANRGENSGRGLPVFRNTWKIVPSRISAYISDAVSDIDLG